ncbi:GNAT family N-acetyltransferase [Nocardia jiangxiensis]|uniref:GNAT family N-acetyltransferase n=1 Tax=Nocardia jiangxiensis TaxID=282685 RepID=A0ABW6RWZ5_9NOCA|nr:GNAT family N-acetyltransferase [Nocardia jiangxiensis]
MTSGPEVRDNSVEDRFELFVDGNLAGIAEYQDTASERAFVHTEVFSHYSGKGYARLLVDAALDNTRQQGFGVLPLCPMVRHIVESEPEYLALVPAWARGRFELPQ